MPPVTKDGQETFRKEVEFTEKDEDEQIGRGVVMVPDKADLQWDFVREDVIRDFADQFETFADAGEADGGIMHAVWPSDWMELEENRVLDEAEEIGGVEVPAGAWIQAWRFNEDQLWALVDDGILEGYSIGAIDVRWDGPYEQDEVDDVGVPDELDDEALLWEIVSGIIREVSAVDIPAVPDALIHETKADAEKRLGNYLPDPNGFIEEAMERGHSEEDAERLWDVLSDAVEEEGATEPGDKSVVGRLLSALSTGGGRKGAGEPEQPDREKQRRQKEGRTLSTANERRQMAVIDAALDTLQDAGVDHGMTRFTDREGTDFDLSEHQAREWDDPDEEDEDGEADSNPFDVDNTKNVTKEDAVGVDVFRVIAAADDDTDYDGDLLGMGVDFPEHDVYVDWRREAFPEPLDDPHVSVYGSIDDLEQATGNVIESLDTVASPTDALANMAQRIHKRAAEAAENHASEGDTSESGSTNAADNMTDDNDSNTDASLDDVIERLDDLKDAQEENSKRLDEQADQIENALDDSEPKTAEIEIGGEVVEVTEEQAKSWFDENEGDKDAFDDAPAWAEQLKEQQEATAQRVDRITQQSGIGSDQLDAAAGETNDGGESALDDLGKALS